MLLSRSEPTPASARWGSSITAVALTVIALATLSPAFPTRELTQTPWWCLVCGRLGTVDVILNIILFVPLGIGLALRTRGCLWQALLMGTLFSCAIELAQLLVIPGRDASLSDLLTNTAGTMAGLALGHYRRSLLAPTVPRARRLAGAVAGFWLLIQGVTAWSLAPDLPPTTYFSQLAPDLGQREVFDGQVLSATLGPQLLASGPIQQSELARNELLSGSRLTALIRTGTLTSTLAPIVNIADDHQRQLAGLGQRGHDLRFGIRLRAERLRLRSPDIVLADALPPSNEEVVVVAGWMDATGLHVGVEGPEGWRTATAAPSASLGWLLIAPISVGIGRATRLGTLVWLMGWLMPVGYWSIGFHVRAWPFLTATVIATLGLLVVPAMAGLPPSPWVEWLAVGTGMALGRWIRGRVARATD